MAGLGQQTVEFSTLVRRAAEESFLSLKELVEKSAGQSDSEKKISLLKYINRTRQRMLRLHVVAKWCQQIPLVQYCQQLASTLSSHDTCFTQAADYLFSTHEGLQQARAPIYDVPSAIEILLTGTYQRLPKCIEDIGKQNVLSEEHKRPALLKLDILLRSRLLESTLPKEISKVIVSDGTAQVRVDGEFKVLVTLGYRGYLSKWRILHLELLVGDKNGLVKLEETRRHALSDDLERRMAASENPFAILYSILHEFCINLVMDTIVRQLRMLRQSRWKDVIQFELISDGAAGQGSCVQLSQDAEPETAATSSIRTPALRITYWLDPDKTTGASDSSLSPFIKIEPGQHLQIRCSHSAHVIDPVTGNEAEFVLNQSCIDVEQLLLRAISCNRHTRLLEVHKELISNSQICQTAGDVTIKCLSDESETDLSKASYKLGIMDGGEEVLCVRAYGSSYITLGIDIRNGFYVLRSLKNIISPSTLLECEEALNQGSTSTAEMFIRLRIKSILHLFASMGRFLGLKVYEQGFSTAKLPKNITHGSDLLLMGFPESGSSYYLLMQLDRGLRPLFTLIELQEELSGMYSPVEHISNIKRFKKIDVSKMHLADDEVNLNLLDWEKLNFIPKDLTVSRYSSEHGLSSDFAHEGPGRIVGYKQSTFACIVDEIFEIEKGASLPPTLPIKNQNSLMATSSSSPLGSVQVSYQGIKPGITSTKSDSRSHVVQSGNFSNFVSGLLPTTNSLYPPNSTKSMLHSSSINSFSPTSSVRSPPIPKLSVPKADVDSLSFRSPPHPADVGPYSVLDEHQLRIQNEASKEPHSLVSGGRTIHAASLARTSSRGSTLISKSGGPKGSLPAHSVASPVKSSSSRLRMASLMCQTQDSAMSHNPALDGTGEKNLRKRSLSNILTSIPSLSNIDPLSEPRKRRKISESVSSSHAVSPDICSSPLSSKPGSCSYGNLLIKANNGHAPSSVYFAVLIHVVRHCSLSIKHARLTSQMNALEIPLVEEVALRNPSCNLWFRMPQSCEDSWQRICLQLGRPGTMCWDVKVSDQHFGDLWELQKGSTSTLWGSGVRIANTSDTDLHIRYDSEGVILSYKNVEEPSIKKLVEDLRRLSNARLFALGMRKLLGTRMENNSDDAHGNSEDKGQAGTKGTIDIADKMPDQLKKSFRIEAVGLMSLWFSYYGSMPGIVVRFVIEWEAGKDGCTMHVSPDQLWPHTKFLEDFINGAEVSSLLDCIRLTAGPLLALAGAIRPARMVGPGSPAVHATTTVSASTLPRQNVIVASQGLLPGALSSNTNPSASGSAVGNTAGGTPTMGSISNHGPYSAAMPSAAGRGGPGIVPSSLLPTDVSVVLRGPYWIRIIYRKNFQVDMRCFAGDQVWLQPATPPKGGAQAGGSLPCPQFRPFIMEHVAQGLNNLDANFNGGVPSAIGSLNSNNLNPTSSAMASQLTATTSGRLNGISSVGLSRPGTAAGNQGVSLSRISSNLIGASNLAAANPSLPVRLSPGAVVPVQVRGELSSAFMGLGDDGGYGGGWVPLTALKKVLRSTLKYLGVLWLFAQLPDLIKEILGSILKDNEGTLLNLDSEQPALRFFVGGYVFAVSVHRMQLLLQVLSVKRFHHQQQQQNQPNSQEELTTSEIAEICDYFSRRVASEPYDASRVASFITVLTLPVPVLREFLKLISWKKGLVQGQFGDVASVQRPQIELCLESHSGFLVNEHPDNSSRGTSKSNIHYDRSRNSVDFGLTLVLDPTHVPHINAAGGAAWLPYCVSIRLRYTFGETTHMSLLGMEGSHGGRACWSRLEDWERCKQRVAKAVEVYGSGNAGGDGNQGRLRIVAEFLLRALQSSLQQLRDGQAVNIMSATT